MLFYQSIKIKCYFIPVRSRPINWAVLPDKSGNYDWMNRPSVKVFPPHTTMRSMHTHLPKGKRVKKTTPHP